MAPKLMQVSSATRMLSWPLNEGSFGAEDSVWFGPDGETRPHPKIVACFVSGVWAKKRLKAEAETFEEICLH